MTTTSQALTDVAGVLLVQRRRVYEIADVLARYGFNRLAAHARGIQAAGPAGDLAQSAAAHDGEQVGRPDPAVANWTTGARLRAALTELGTTWVKLGQLLSVRPDLVGHDIARELTALQAAVPADRPEYAEEVIAAELGRPVQDVFASFNAVPLASGSVAQVHEATLPDGSHVVVKVLHEGVERRVHSDLELMGALAVFIEAVDPELARFRPSALVAEFDTMMRAAVDLTHELDNLHRFRANFAGEPDTLIPQDHPDLSSPRVATMEQMTGNRLSDQQAVEALGWPIQELVERTTRIYLEMIFRDGVYHADPHPGNFLLQPDRRIVFLDFGDVGTLSRGLRKKLTNMLIAMSRRDYDELTEAVLALTGRPAGVDRASLAADVEAWAERYLGDDLATADLPSLLVSEMTMLRRNGLSLPAELVMLVRVLLLLQGLSDQVGATLNLTELISPYVEEMAREQLGAQSLGRQAERSARSWAQLLGAFPDDLREILGQLRDGSARVDFQVHDAEGKIDHLVDGLLVSALVVTAGGLLSNRTKPMVGDLSVPGAVTAVVAGITYAGLRRRRPGYQTGFARLARIAETIGARGARARSPRRR